VFVAISTRCFADLPLSEACGQILDLEFDKLELWMNDASAHLRAADVAADPERFAQQYREMTRIAPIAICLAHDLETTALQGLCKAAKQLRISQITVPAAPLGTPFNSEIERLRALAGLAVSEGVRLSIRTETGTVAEDPHTAVELCDAVPGLGVTLDPSHLLRLPSPDDAIDLVLPKTFHVALRDSTPQSLQVQVGLGEVDYSRLTVQLERRGYDRALSIEFLPELMDLSLRPLELRKMRMLLESLL